ncbi:MAG: hypothetical protein M1827_005572 [Pycnora praestabilis]|nr:MAG: hypothetical protein M1827_005572 [Pycnora praestabilis]
MKTSFTSLIALSGFFAGVFSAPTVEVAGIEKRQTSSAISIVSSLYATVQQHTGAINSTTSTLTSSSSAAEKAAAQASIQSAISSITTAVQGSTSQIHTLAKSNKRDVSTGLEVRQAADTNELAALVEDLLLDISGALNNIIATLGLTGLLNFLTPLVGSLSNLLLALEVVVNNLLAIVQALLDGL